MRLTDDHSLVDELIRQGRLTPEEAEEHPQRSIITRALGPEETVEVDTRSFRARAGDVYLLCSDGLTSMVPEARLAEVLRWHAGERLRDVGEALIAEANRRRRARQHHRHPAAPRGGGLAEPTRPGTAEQDATPRSSACPRWATRRQPRCGRP